MYTLIRWKELKLLFYYTTRTLIFDTLLSYVVRLFCFKQLVFSRSRKTYKMQSWTCNLFISGKCVPFFYLNLLL